MQGFIDHFHEVIAELKADVSNQPAPSESDDEPNDHIMELKREAVIALQEIVEDAFPYGSVHPVRTAEMWNDVSETLTPEANCS